MTSRTTKTEYGVGMRIYYDRWDDDMDGHGWNVILGPVNTEPVAARFRTQAEAKAWAQEHGPMVGHPFWSRIPERFRWTVHNVVAHPVSEILWQIGLVRLSDWVHDVTVPPGQEGGR